MPLEGTPERRQGNLAFEPDTGLLVVGSRLAVLESHPVPSALVGTYVELVVAQRGVAPASHVDLRSRELVQLSTVLELPPSELDALIDRELVRFLTGAAQSSGASALAVGWSGRRRLFVFGGLAVLAAGATVAATLASQGSTARLPRTGPTATAGGGTVEVIELEGGGTATRTESAPAPVGADGTDIGTAVIIERNP